MIISQTRYFFYIYIYSMYIEKEMNIHVIQSIFVASVTQQVFSSPRRITNVVVVVIIVGRWSLTETMTMEQKIKVLVSLD